MWIWWIVSLIILIACFIFAYRMITSSYDFLPRDKKNFMGFKKENASTNPTPGQQEIISSLRNKLQSVEHSISFYEIQFSKFQQRLKALEELNNLQQKQTNVQPKGDGEDWKEMYYEENEAKEKLENELDETSRRLEEAESRSQEVEKNNRKWIGLQSDYDARLNDLHSMQNNIGLMQRQLEAAAGREKELEQILLSEIDIKKKYSQLESNHLRLQSETEDLRRQVIEMNQKGLEMESRIARLNELESSVAIYAEEKAKMISEMELMISQNKIFPV